MWEDEFLELNDISFVSRKVHSLREEFNLDRNRLFEIAQSEAMDTLFDGPKGEKHQHLAHLEQEYFKKQINLKLD